MAPPKLSPIEKQKSILKRKQYQREYHKLIPVELKRIYNKAYRDKKMSKQILKNDEKNI